ncbi:methylglutaconyl-CoA hydratase [Microdochium nivale]|nr:methylglutaconyl-CoA hydratase [Microdochium nivale]
MPPRLPLGRRIPAPLGQLLQATTNRRRTAHLFSSSYSTDRTAAAAAAAEPSSLITVTDVKAPGSGHIRVLELNRPAARNAISRGLLSALRAEVDAVQSQYDADGNEVASLTGGETGPTRALVLASAIDTSFCAGADLKERKGFTQEETAAFLKNLRSTFTALAALPVPTISAISSLALGGGLELALSTHFRVLTSTAAVGLPETRLGILPGAGGTYRLPGLIGMPRARDLILTGRRVSAPEAYFLGIADRLVEVLPDEAGPEGEAHTAETERLALEAVPGKARRLALAEAVRLAMEICEGGPVAVRAALQAVGWAREEVENEMYQRVVATEDRDEALRAFGEKRKPVFKGR